MLLSLIRTVCNTNRGQLLNLPSVSQICLRNSLHSFTSSGILTRLLAVGDNPSSCWSLISVRTNIRNNFPRPNERKRLQMSFWNRMKTRGGRAILMRRYLKGKHVLSH